jgi:hypothetical protein
MKHKKIWQPLFVALTLTATFTGCKKDEPEPTDNTFSGNGTFIICEGKFQAGNGRLDFYSTLGDSLISNIFEKANGVPVGDVFQSMLVVNDRAYLAVNNSGTVVVVNPVDMKSIGTISGISSPRYVVYISTSKAYVSDLYGNKVAIVNPSTLSVTGQVPVKGNADEIIYKNNRLWITNQAGNHLYIAQNDVVVDSIDVGYGSSSIREDNSGNVWTLTYGNWDGTAQSKLSKINPTTLDVVWDYEFNNFGGSKLRTNGDKTLLYFLFDGKVYRKNANDNSNPVEFISLPGKSFYGINVDPSTGNIWLGEPADFASPGTVFVFNSSGTKINEFATGIVPTDFVF